MRTKKKEAKYTPKQSNQSMVTNHPTNQPASQTTTNASQVKTNPPNQLTNPPQRAIHQSLPPSFFLFTASWTRQNKQPRPRALNARA